MVSPLWVPSAGRVAGANLTRFASGQSYSELWRWSIARPDEFWQAMWDFAAVRGERGSRVVVDPDRMPGARFFPDASLNFAENVLRDEGDGPAILYKGESAPLRTVSWRELRHDVAAFAAAL